MNIQTINNQALRKVMEISTDNLWFFQPLNERGEIDRPIFKEGLWYYPLNDNSTLPTEALTRLKAVNNLVSVRQVIIGHEAPPLLCGEVKKKEPINIPWGEIGKVLTALASGFVSLLGMAVLTGASILVDPVVVCVLEDGTWVKVYSWLD